MKESPIYCLSHKNRWFDEKWFGFVKFIIPEGQFVVQSAVLTIKTHTHTHTHTQRITHPWLYTHEGFIKHSNEHEDNDHL